MKRTQVSRNAMMVLVTAALCSPLGAVSVTPNWAADAALYQHVDRHFGPDPAGVMNYRSDSMVISPHWFVVLGREAR